MARVKEALVDAFQKAKELEDEKTKCSHRVILDYEQLNKRLKFGWLSYAVKFSSGGGNFVFYSDIDSIVESINEAAGAGSWTMPDFLLELMIPDDPDEFGDVGSQLDLGVFHLYSLDAVIRILSNSGISQNKEEDASLCYEDDYWKSDFDYSGPD